MVVDLAIVGDPNRAVFVAHRLATSLRQVDDRQPTVTQNGAATSVEADAVATAVNLRGGHPFDRSDIVGHEAVAPHEPSYPAHAWGIRVVRLRRHPFEAVKSRPSNLAAC